jgi:hypothetical protein
VKLLHLLGHVKNKVRFRIKILRKDTYGMTQMEYGLVTFCKTSTRDGRSGKKLKKKDYGKKERFEETFCALIHMIEGS